MILDGYAPFLCTFCGRSHHEKRKGKKHTRRDDAQHLPFFTSPHHPSLSSLQADAARMASPTARNLPALSTADGWLIALMLSLAMVPAILWLAWTLTRYHWARPTGHEQDSPRMSADTVSSLFPDRPIRPLPKRRLRERLSPEVADSIQFPPAPQTVTPLFPYPYPLRDEEPDIGSLSRERAPEVERIARRNGLGIESDEDDAVLRRDLVSLGVTDPPGRLARPPLKTEHGRRANPQLPHSAASSVDGYDLFENSNKKKRKIPTAGDAALNGVHATNDSGIGSGPLSTNTQSGEGHGETPIPTSTPYYGSGSFASGGQNVAGPGRGRYGRPRSGRSPLRPLSDSTNNWAGRNGKLRPGPWGSGASKLTCSVNDRSYSKSGYIDHLRTLSFPHLSRIYRIISRRVANLLPYSKAKTPGLSLPPSPTQRSFLRSKVKRI